MTETAKATRGLTLPQVRALWNEVNRRLLASKNADNHVDNYLEFSRLSPYSRRMITALALDAYERGVVLDAYERGVQSAWRLADAARTATHVAEDAAAKHGRCLHCGGRLPDDTESADAG